MLVTKQPVLQRFWYPILKAADVGAEPKPFTLLGKNIVVWRGPDGSLACLQDRCCHRTAKLSLGFVEDGNIVCGYLGWTFAADGTCVRIPQLDDDQISARARVPGYMTKRNTATSGSRWPNRSMTSPTSPRRRRTDFARSISSTKPGISARCD